MSADPVVDALAATVLLYLDGEGRSTLEAAISVWHDLKWPDNRDLSDRLMAAKLAEEAGEVCGAIIKRAEGRRTDQDVKDEIGDVLIVLSVIAGRHEWTLADLLADRARTVVQR